MVDRPALHHLARYVAGLRAAPRWRSFQRAGRADRTIELAADHAAAHRRAGAGASQRWTAGGHPALRRKIVPLGSYIIATEPLPEALAREVSPRNRMIFDSKRFLYYFRLTPDRRMLFGGRAGFFPETPATVRESAVILRRGMLQVYPQLRDARVEYAWGGTLDVTFDMMPHAGQLGGLHYAIGYAGHGVAMATTAADWARVRHSAGEPVDNPFAELWFLGDATGRFS